MTARSYRRGWVGRPNRTGAIGSWPRGAARRASGPPLTFLSLEGGAGWRFARDPSVSPVPTLTPAVDDTQSFTPRPCGVHLFDRVRPYAATVYSWMRPPSRSRLRIAVADGLAVVGGGCRGSGGARPSARCGLWAL